MKKEIENIPLANLIPYARNARSHTDGQIAKIAGSIREFGFCNPVLIDERDGIIAGHGRVLAAQKLGLTEAPCLRLSHLTDTQRRAYILADNRIALDATWDAELLSLEIDDLKTLDFNLELTGFDPEELNGLFGPDDGAGQEVPASSAQELDPDQYEMGHRCPRCGFEFDEQA